jgi:hypothetical protein
MSFSTVPVFPMPIGVQMSYFIVPGSKCVATTMAEP